MLFFKKHPYLSSGIIIIVIIIAAITIFGSSGNKTQTIVVKHDDYTNRVTVAGKVVASVMADLGFDQNGRISAIYVSVGQEVKTGTTLASIDKGAASADLEQKQALLNKERAKLAALERGTRSEELAVSQQSYDDATSALVNAMHSAQVETEGAILTKTDSLFDHGTTANPEINIRTQSRNEKLAIERDRLLLGEKMSKWKTMLSQLQTTSDKKSVQDARNFGVDTMASEKRFIDALAAITRNLTPENSGLSQTEIDTDQSTVNSAGSQAAAASAAEQTAYTTWTTADRNLTLKLAGNASEDIEAQLAQVKSAEADVLNAQAQLRNRIIVAPFDGVITRIDTKIGEVSSPSDKPLAIMSTGTFEIESYVPEVYISRVKIDDPATITLDAYGTDTEFKASVISIDPAETVKDGVSTYKTRLRFTNTESSPRILSGMTATIVITTDFIPNTIMIPRSVITTDGNIHTVKIRRADSILDVPVEVGVVGPLGQTQIISGLSDGDEIVVPEDK